MQIRRKGNKWEINYRCPGYPKLISERFSSEEEARARCLIIEAEKIRGTLTPPERDKESKTNRVYTVRDLLQEYVDLVGVNSWSPSYLSYSQQRINDYILPFIGDEPIRFLTTHKLDNFFKQLSESKVKHRPGRNDENDRVSPSTTEKVFVLLRAALNQAIIWGKLKENPAKNCTLPAYDQNDDEAVWTEEEAIAAIRGCENPILRAAIIVAISCTARIAEVLGLRWEDISFEEGSVQIVRQIQRVNLEALETLSKRKDEIIIFVFPPKKQNAKSVLILKYPKTKKSKRRVFVGDTTCQTFHELQEIQNHQKALLGEQYNDYALVFCNEDGTPIEARRLEKMFDQYVKEAGLKPVCFHSLRKCGTSLKLRISRGDVKVVQRDTGHTQARMVLDTYAKSHAEDQVRLSQDVEQQFFARLANNGTEGSNEDSELISMLRTHPEYAKKLESIIKLLDQ